MKLMNSGLQLGKLSVFIIGANQCGEEVSDFFTNY